MFEEFPDLGHVNKKDVFTYEEFRGSDVLCIRSLRM